MTLPILMDDTIFKRYYNELGMPHRDDGPAVIAKWGDKYWLINGDLHREDGPAIMYNDGRKEWWYKGERHNEDGPAIVSPNSLYWYRHGKIHREDGPAVKLTGVSIWYNNNDIHRVDGPAIEYSDGNKSWYLFGEHYSREEFYRVKRVWRRIIYKMRKRMRERLFSLMKSTEIDRNILRSVCEFAY